MDILRLVGRDKSLFDADIRERELELRDLSQGSRFLVIGGAGSIGRSVVREIFIRSPEALHIVDINENNMVELVRDIRSTLGYGGVDFRTFSIDSGGREYEALIASSAPYDYVLNLSALKHVRSEKDPYTLMRMISVNIFNAIKVLELARIGRAKNYFCVSTDKAANPVNMMGASKRIMEMFLMRESVTQPVSLARFANVAFSDGSLLHGFNQRLIKRHPISAPRDVRRYFLTPQEAGELCLMSCMLGGNRDIFFPKLSESLHLVTFPEVATRYLQEMGFAPYECESEDEARARAEELISRKKWPCLFFESDTTGEKSFEEFFTEGEELDMVRFNDVGVIRNAPKYNDDALKRFEESVLSLRSRSSWTKESLVRIFKEMLPAFSHMETGKYLDDRM